MLLEFLLKISPFSFWLITTPSYRKIKWITKNKYPTLTLIILSAPFNSAQREGIYLLIFWRCLFIVNDCAH